VSDHAGAGPAEGAVEARLEHDVTAADTAHAVGSGSLEVLGTPRLLAWCEAATCAAIDPLLDDDSTSVGTRVSLEHLAASPVGARLEVTATRTHVDGRLHRFAVAARALGRDGTPGTVLATGEVTRVVVDVERFLARL
jgi:predicted thioesterase